jgi:hypothetical protein
MRSVTSRDEMFAGSYYPLDTIDTVPRAYEGTGEKINENVIHNKIQDFKNTFF